MKVLIIDDELLFAQFLNDLLLSEIENIQTEMAHDGFDAGIKLRDFKPDIVLLDLNMPGFDGFRVCKQIEQENLTQDIKVIAITGDAREDIGKRIISTGAIACLAKPIDVAELIKIMHS